ncbi:calcium-binding protein, partial [Sulfuricurvum sp.]|uniref:calcium-binding protein n=1 Tax=Sulfuricurvum sp. TaxID=2025608 RepID=UPI00262F5803
MFTHDENADIYHPIDGLAGAINYTLNVPNELWNSGITKFIDPQGRAIYYGTNGDDPIIASNIGSKLTDYRLANQVGTVQIAGKGNDTLRGNDYGLVLLENKSDYLLGGTGYDKYIAGNGDTLMDSDGSGIVSFEGIILHGGVSESGGCKPDGSGEYKGDGGVYKLSGGKLTFTKDGSGETLTIEKFVNGDLGITLTSDDPGASCPPPPEDPDDSPTPGDPNPNFPSPLILDLNGDGVTSTFISETSTYFDLDNDGVRQRTGWVQSTDALLVFDKNQDGVINNGTELFGNNTILKNGTKAANGFEALKEYDENKDGLIDNRDNIYNTLQLWQDTNSDGVTDTGELHSLSELGVASINLDYATTDDYEEQNRIFQTSTFTTTEGTTQSINDVWFMTESRDTVKESVTLSDSVAALPDYRGAGRVESLSTAMNESTALETAVTSLLAKASTSTYTSLLSDTKTILALWTHTDNIDPTETRGEQWIMNHNYTSMQKTGSRYRVYAYARDVAILEAFWGQNFTMAVDGESTSDVIGTEMSNYMSNAFISLTDTVLATLLVQQLYGKDAYDVTTGSFDYAALFDQLDTTLITGTTEEKTTASNLLATLIHRDGLETLLNLDTAILADSAFKTLLKSNGITYAIRADGTISGSYDNTIEGSSANDTLQAVTDGTVYGGEGNDVIRGTNGSYTYSSTGNATGNEELHGGEGNDTIYGGSGSDILYGDAGDDILYANGINEYGSNSYGHDILIGGTGNDTLYGTGRNSTYVYNYGDGFDTIIDPGNVGLTPDILELRGIRFDNIQVRNVGNDMVISIKDAVDSSVIIGSITIKNGYGNGKIESFIFDDITLDFSLIHDTNDIYTFNFGDGINTIKDMGSIDGDILQFGDGITIDDIEIKVSPSSNNLIVALKEEGKTFSELSDKLTIVNWFNADNRIETFEFSDGTTWDVDAILAHQGTDEADTARLLDINADTTLDMGGGNDTVTTGTGNDTVTAGEGNDSVSTGKGNDVLIGSTGNDTLNGGAGDDAYVFNIGDGIDTITDSAGSDTVVFGEGISADDVIIKLVAYSNDLIIGLKEEGVTFSDLSDKITLKNWFVSDSRIENFVFNDGTEWDVNDIIGGQATEGDDIIRPADVNTAANIHLLGGDDYISTGNADDTVYGDSGDDNIQTQGGDDTLIGGKGADYLQGGIGDDTYLFSKGDGNDIIVDSAGNDTIAFGEGITQDDLVLRQEGNNLRIAIKDGSSPIDALSDTILVKGWFSQSTRIENISFSDGSKLIGAEEILALIGSDSNDTFTWKESALTLNMDAGNDSVVLGNLDDTISGGTGDDTLQGGGGNDTYIYNRGDGSDTITDIESYQPYYWSSTTQLRSGGNDTLKFEDGITADDIIIKASANSNDLIVAIKEDNKTFDELSDKITLKNWFNADYRIENFAFNDGTMWDVNDIVNAQGTEEADTVHLIDSITNVTLNLGDGDDTVVTASGNDTITGGIGNDTLSGGAGDDTYVFSRGDGIDTIIETAGNDTIEFAEGISANNLIVKASANSNDLIVALKEDGKTFDELTDKITLKNWFNTDYRIENFAFNDGTMWDVDDIVNAQGTEEADTVHLIDSITNVTLNLGDGDDTVVTASGNDTITGGIGNDTLSGGAGDDTYVFSRGDSIDTIIDIEGVDTLQFGEGISVDDIVVQAVEGSYDLIVAIKEDGKTFDELTDKITLKNWYSDENRVERFSFTSGDVLDTLAITELQATDSDDNYLRYLDHDNTINAHEGDDTIEGGAGNDTYLFNRGDGIDHITDITGMDTLIFGTDITSEDIEVHADNNYLIIGLKEDGKTFDELSDKIYFRRIGTDDYGIETVAFEDG